MTIKEMINRIMDNRKEFDECVIIINGKAEDSVRVLLNDTRTIKEHKTYVNNNGNKRDVLYFVITDWSPSPKRLVRET